MKYIKNILFIVLVTFAGSANALRCPNAENIHWVHELEGLIIESKLIDEDMHEYIKKSEGTNALTMIFVTAHPEYKIFVHTEENEKNLITDIKPSKCYTNFSELNIGQEIVVYKFGQYRKIVPKQSKTKPEQ